MRTRTGPIGDNGLVSPEGQLATGPNIIGYMNGMYSFVEYGLTACFNGFGDYSVSRGNCWKPYTITSDLNDGNITYSPNATTSSDDVVRSLDLLLTNGRLDAEHHNIVKNAYESNLFEYADGPRASNSYWGTLPDGSSGYLCDNTWWGNLNDAQLKCNKDPACTHLHDQNKDGLYWRVCTGIIEQTNGPAATKIKVPCNGTCQNDDIALKKALHLMVNTPEYHATNLPVPGETRANATEFVRDPNRAPSYKAVVMLFLKGGCDSYNLLIPHSNCGAKDLNAEYHAVRTTVGIDNNRLLPITSPPGEQPCDTMAVTPAMPGLRDMYEIDGDAAFMANIGTLFEPMTKEEYLGKTKRFPRSLYAHNTQTEITSNVHAGSLLTKGILGRLGDALGDIGYNTGAYSIAGNEKALEAENKAYEVLSSGDKPVVKYNGFGNLYDDLEKLTKTEAKSVFAETASKNLKFAVETAESLGDVLDSTFTNATFPDTSIGRQLRNVARVIKARSKLNAERDTFFVEQGKFDTHNDEGAIVEAQLGEVDAALMAFAQEMKGQGVWDDVVVIETSEFGRTLKTNGQGTDHAWGGNYFMVGGKVKGRRIHGQYPHDLTDDGPFSVRSNGRLLPTTSWEAIWHGVAEWFGVVPEDMDRVIPNKKNFPQSAMFTKDQMFEA